MRGRSEGKSSKDSSHHSIVKVHVFSILSVGFGVAALAMILAATLTPTGQISGQSLVTVEVQVLPGFYMKPITFFTYCLFLCFGFGLYSPKTRGLFLNVSPDILRAVYVVAWLVAMASGFEIVYHIVIWSASLAVQGLSNPDIIVNPFPVSVNPTPVNVVFAAKIVVTIFFMSLFLIDYVRRIDRIRRERELDLRLHST
ncbi:MAG TPA: hypothetical protein VJZ32_04755 [Candidatus Bathyarchaeia archaeon]|nr:hypothetical protein [Candidatus Bathyarchaeia archaeon]